MRADERCLICYLIQSARIFKIHVRSAEERWKRLQDVMEDLSKLGWGMKPLEIAEFVYPKISKILQKSDPFAEVKRRSNELAKSVLEKIEREIRYSSDPLYDASKLAIAGNLIDLGNPNWEEDRVFDKIVEILEKPFGIDDFEEFKEDLRRASTVLYIVDNSGEIVFDKFFITIAKEYNPALNFLVAAREKPIINDATVEDVLSIGMDEVARVMSSGMEIPGTIVERASDEFRRAFFESDIVISKGQGNFEGLINEPREIYFMLTVKCDVVADFLKTAVGTLIFMKKRVSE